MDAMNHSPEARDALIARYRLQPMRVLESHEMVDVTHPLGQPKRFLTLQLTDGVSYRTGDHLAALPRNPQWLVQRVADRFGLDPQQVITLEKGRRGLPVGIPVTVGQLLAEFIEIRFPPSAIGVRKLAAQTVNADERERLTAIADLEREEFRQQVTNRELSVLDFLEQFPSCALPFEGYLELVRPIRLRSYSISSSPQIQPDRADLMVALLDEPHRAGEGSFRGVASELLQDAQEGDELYAHIVPCQEAFRLPEDPEVPVILISAGTGLAPFRGMVQDRMQEPGAPMLVYFGCRHPDVDFLHRAELEAADVAGVISLRPAFSRAPEGEARYVQHRIAQEGDEVWDLLAQGAHVRVCGDGRHMAPDVQAAFRNLHRRRTGSSEEEAAAWLHNLVVTDRYVEDVWAG